MGYEQELLRISIGKLVAKEIDGTITGEEKERLETFLNTNPESRIIYEDLINEHHRNILFDDLQAYDGQLAFKRFEEKIQPRPMTRKRIWPKLVAAAVLLLVSGIGLYFYTGPAIQPLQQTIVRDVSPGGNKATLRLADGRVIDLGQQQAGTIVSAPGINITKTKDGQLIYSVDQSETVAASGSNTISTPRGGQYQVVLPDHSTVWLNAASSLTYAASLNERGDGKRRVTLSGEAYFEITKDKAHPFVVSTSTQEVEVLGTHFNINSYKDEAVVRTTLLEGSVKVSTKGQKVSSELLKPGQQSTVSSDNISIASADLESVMAWKNDLFVFKDTDVPTIMGQLSRWYNVDVTYEGDIPTDLFSGGISRKSNLSTVLKMLDLIKIKTAIVQTPAGNKIIVYPSSRK